MSDKEKMMPYSNKPNMPSNMQPTENDVLKYKALYPEVFYKAQPYVIMVCDELENMGNVSPSQEMIENITDNIYKDMHDMYPEMAEYMDQTESTETIVLPYGRGFGRPFRRRGAFRDLISILLLSELFGRRRRRW
jgi:hypothetical protein